MWASLDIGQEKDALFLRSRDVQWGFIPRGIQTSSYMLHMVSLSSPLLSLSLPPSPSLSLSLLSQSVHSDAAQRQDLASASSSYLTHPPRFTHSTRGAFSCPAVLLKVAREGGRFRSPVTLLLWLASGGLTALDVAELRIPDRLYVNWSKHVDYFPGTFPQKQHLNVKSCTSRVSVPGWRPG